MQRLAIDETMIPNRCLGNVTRSLADLRLHNQMIEDVLAEHQRLLQRLQNPDPISIRDWRMDIDLLERSIPYTRDQIPVERRKCHQLKREYKDISSRLDELRRRAGEAAQR